MMSATFQPVVVLGQDEEIRHAGANFPHAVAAQLAAVAAAAEHDDKPVRLIGPQRFQQAFGGGFVVGIINQDGKIVADRHQFHPAFDNGAAQPFVDGFIRKAKRFAGADCGQRV